MLTYLSRVRSSASSDANAEVNLGSLLPSSGCGAAQEVVQARMMEQVVSCKDEIAQQYLMQCIIQGFPDEFHLGTLPTLLAALPELQEGVRVHLILASLLDRLSRCCS